MESTYNNHIIEFDESLDRFLKGKMNAEEEREFKTLLVNNPDLKIKALATARMAKEMQSVGSLHDREVIEEIKDSSLDAVKSQAAQACGASNHKVRIFPFRRVLISMSAAASIMLCIFGGYKYYKYEQVTSLGQEYIAYFPASEFSRGEDDEMAIKLENIYTNISDKTDIDAAISELSAMWSDSQSETYNEYTEYMPELGWMLANAYLCNNEKGKALEVLDKLITEFPNDTAVGEKARELMAKISNL